MPELPEVETVVRDLRPLVVGRRLTAVEVGPKGLRRRWSAEWGPKVEGRRVAAVERRGKWIMLDLGGPWLLVHLGMTGQFTAVPRTTEREDHTHLVFALSPGKDELRFRDIRRFGSVTLYESREELEAFFADSNLGPEPFALDADYWRERLRGTARNIKAILLDQTVVAGVGNIYADEALFAAKLHPTLTGRDLTPRQADRLRLAVVDVLTRAIERRGSTIRNYVGGSGLSGEFQGEHAAYGRTGEPCRRCKGVIERIVLAGRSTHFCPKCQKAV